MDPITNNNIKLVSALFLMQIGISQTVDANPAFCLEETPIVEFTAELWKALSNGEREIDDVFIENCLLIVSGAEKLSSFVEWYNSEYVVVPD